MYQQNPKIEFSQYILNTNTMNFEYTNLLCLIFLENVQNNGWYYFIIKRN